MFSTPLSPVLYLFRNKLKTFWIVLIVALTVVISSTILGIVGSFNNDVKNTTAMYKKFDMITYNKGQVQTISLEDLKSDLQTNSNIAKVYEIKPLNLKNKGIFGALPIQISFISNSDYDSFLNDVGWQIVDGKMPEKGTNQLALTQNLLRNKGLKIGDKVGKNIDRSDYLSGEYQIVGVLKENEIRGGVGNMEYLESISSLGNLQTASSFSTTLAIFPKEGRDLETETFLNSFRADNPDLIINTKTSINDDYKRDYQSISQISNVLTFIVVFIISLTMGLLNLIFIINRSYEFGLMGALHFSKWFIIQKILIERFMEIILGWLLGLTLLIGVFLLINQFIYNPLGNVGLNPFDLSIIWATIPVPIAIFIFSAVGLYIYLIRLDPIEIIERNS